MEPLIRNRFTALLFVTTIAIAVFAIMPNPDTRAENPENIRALQSDPVFQEPLARPADASNLENNDNRPRRIQEALRGHRDNMPPAFRGTPGKALSQTRADRSMRLKRGLDQETHIHYRSDTGTPRQIRLSPEARRRGDVLEKAVRGPGSQRERDEATARAFLRSRQCVLKISNPDREMKLSRYETDALGRRRLRYAQAYKGLRVWPAELNVHLDHNGHVDLMNGSFMPTPRRMVTIPVLDAHESTELARKAVPGGQGTPAEAPELIVYTPGDRSPRLAWKNRIPVAFDADWLVVIDAENGRTLTAFNRVPGARATGFGTDLFGNARQLGIWAEGNAYYMVNAAKPMFRAFSDPPAMNTINGVIIVRDMNNNRLPQYGSIDAAVASSSHRTSGWIPDAVSLAYNLSEIYDYYFERHNRDSMDGNGGTVLGFVRVQSDAPAFYSPDAKAVFFNSAHPYAGTLDVVAHEYTHGVTHQTANLVYQDQPGALDEALADIFAEMVEARTAGSTDWRLGTGIDVIRCMKDPSSLEIHDTGFYYPSRMSEYYSRDHLLLNKFQNQDYGGVHINNTIISHAFYLLAEGLQDAVGIRDAEKIFYRAMAVHLVSNSQFVDMRLACIAAAEELAAAGMLSGNGDRVVAKVAEAFDKVEIYEREVVTEPPRKPPVKGKDSAIFIGYDVTQGASFLARYEPDKDGSNGVWLSCWDVADSRPSVSGDGSEVFFVDSIQDACFIETDGYCEECLGLPEDGVHVHSVAMSPDKKMYGFVLLENGEPGNTINVVELAGDPAYDKTRVFELVSPATEGAFLNTVQFADSMYFTADNRYLIYDAYNVLHFHDGTRSGAWSIYAIDLLREQTFSLVGPYPDLHVGYPSLGQTTDSLMTFDLVEEIDGAATTTIFTWNLATGQSDVVGKVPGPWSVPGYGGDDSAIYYSRPDANTTTGYSFVRQPLKPNLLGPEGGVSLFIYDADYGVVYRRGDYSPPAPIITVSHDELDFGVTAVGQKTTRDLTISNQGTGHLMISGTNLSGIDRRDFQIRGGCAGMRLAPSDTCRLYIDFIPTNEAVKNAGLTLGSNDASRPVSVRLTGKAVIDPDDVDDVPGNGGSDDKKDGGSGSCFVSSMLPR